MSIRRDFSPQRMQCMEIWGGNRAITRRFQAPGVDVYVHCSPFGSDKVGGDIYYLTSCASGRITRMLLADVSGHGETAAHLAIALRDLLRANVNKISQEDFVQEMNREFATASSDGFATAAVLTYFEPRKSLSLGLAGHPHPLYFIARENRWVVFEPEESSDQLNNLPLGVLDQSRYPGRKIKVRPGDMFLLYSDAFSEALKPDGGQFGTGGILELLNGNRDPDPVNIIPRLRDAIQLAQQENLQTDDATLILGQFTKTRVRWRDNLMAPFRLFQKVRDTTQLSATADAP